MEINIRQTQMASIFAALQQVETRYRKEADTVEEHNRHRALARLTRARYMKNMKSFTKQLKKNTPLTHNYELPTNNNENKLTKKLPPKDNQILIPNIENNIDEELNKLGISDSLKPTDKKLKRKIPRENKEKTTKKKSTYVNEVRTTENANPGATQEREKRASPKEGSSERERNPEACPGNPGSIPEKERSRQAAQENEKRLDALTEADPTVPGTAPEKSLIGIHAAAPTVNEGNTSPAAGPGTERSPGAALTRGDPITERSPGVTQERERRASPEEGIPERERNTGAGPRNPGANPERETSPKAAQEREERLATHTEADPAVSDAVLEKRLIGIHAAGPIAPRDTVLPPPVCVPTAQGRHNRTEEGQRKTSSTSTTVNDEETTGDIVHVYAENKQKEQKNQPSTSDVPQKSNSKLTHQQHIRAYPWAHDASRNTFTKSNLASEVEYIDTRQIDKFLTTEMKKKLTTPIKLPKRIVQEIDDNISEINGEYQCNLCSTIFNKRYPATRHVRIELGYKEHRCSYCNYMSNTTSMIYRHYGNNHGIPKEWICSQNLTKFITSNPNNTNSNIDD